MYNLILGDCLEEMDKLIANGIKVDMILCDLPYGTTMNKWDSVLPMNWIWEKYNQIIKNDGAIVLFGSQPFTSLLISSNYDMYRYSWIWIKNIKTGFINAHFQPLKQYEDICVFSKCGIAPIATNKMKYNPQGIVPYGKTTQRGGAGDNYNRVTKSNYQEFTNYPSNVLYFDKESKSLHPTQKPVSLLEYLIKTYTNDGETVLDNCMGSGSTGVACLNTNRNFIGIELDDRYYNIAKNRLQEAEK